MIGGAQLHKYAKLVVDSMLFDSAFYLQECEKKGIEIGGMSPVLHFLTRFWETGANPHPLFDCKYYCEQHPSLEERELLNPVIHYIRHAKEQARNPHPLFDTEYYRQQSKGLDDSALTPLGHFLATEAAECANPNPYFDTKYYNEQLADSPTTRLNPLVHFLLVGAGIGLNPSPRFDTRYYLKQNPDVARSSYNALEHFLRFGKDEGRAHYSFFSATTFEDTQATIHSIDLDQVLADYKQLRQHEPLLPASTRLDGLPELRMPTMSRAGMAYAKLASIIDKPFSHLFLMPFLLHGGAEKVSMNMVKCVVDRLGVEAPLVLVTDAEDTSAIAWLPQGVRLVVIDELGSELSTCDKEIVVSRFILQTSPQVVTTVNSVVGWNIYRKLGRQLSTVTNLAAGLFGYGFDADNAPDGLAVYYLNHAMDNLTYLFSDTERFRGLLSEQFGFSAEDRKKQIVLYSPMAVVSQKPSEFAAPRISAANKDVLWASRLCPGKRPDVLLAVARAMPSLNFQVWGKADQMSHQLMTELKSQPNIVLHGGYEDFFKIPPGNCGLFLYTTEGDGLPLVLLEAIASGFPVIAPRIGGIAELIGVDTGWLIEDCNDTEGYVGAVLEILRSPETASRRVKNAQNLVRERHLWSSFAKQMASLKDYWNQTHE